MLSNSKTKLVSFLAISTCLALYGCGGGGGGSGSSSGGGSGGGGSSGLNLPSLIEAGINEEEFVSADIEPFRFDVPNLNLEPTNFQLTGPDAADFQVTIGLESVDSNTVQAIINVSSLTPNTYLDFENPLDANGDNIYEITISFDYDGRTYSLPIALSVLDVPEFVNLNLTSVTFDNVEIIGNVGDFNNDAIDDFAIINGDINSPSSFHILSGQELNTAFQNGLTIDGNTSMLSTFNFGAPIGIGQFAMDVAAAPDNNGIDLLFTDFGANKLYEYRLRSSSDYQALLGTIDLTQPADNRIEYSYNFPLNDRFLHRHEFVGDINDDGINDILTDHYLTSGFGTSIGLLFGRQIVTAADRQVTIVNDIDITPINSDPGLTGTSVADIDGDGADELLIIDQNSESNADCLIYSSTLTVTGLSSLDLASINDGEGICLSSFSFGDSYQIDPTDATSIFTSLTGVSVGRFGLASDILNLGAFPAEADLDSGNIKNIATQLDGINNSLVSGLSSLVQISDLTGDGLSDYIATSAIQGSGTNPSPFLFIDAQAIQQALASTDAVPVLDPDLFIPIRPSGSNQNAQGFILNVDDQNITLSYSNQMIILPISTLGNAVSNGVIGLILD